MGICQSSNKNKSQKQVKSKQINELDQNEKVLLECKLCRDKIKNYIKKCEVTASKKRNKAKELLKEKQKDRARVYLSQSKFHLTQAKVGDGQLKLIEDQINELQKAAQLNEIRKVLENGNKVLKELQSEIKIEKWQEIKEDMDGMKEQQDEIAEFLRNNNIDEEEYNNEVKEEFEKLQNDLENELKLPDAPKNDVKVDNDKNKEKEKENKKKIVVEA
jgi:charged multivesicular body protein 6